MSFRDSMRVIWPPIGVAAFVVGLLLELHAVTSVGVIIATAGLREGLRRTL